MVYWHHYRNGWEIPTDSFLLWICSMYGSKTQFKFVIHHIGFKETKKLILTLSSLHFLLLVKTKWLIPWTNVVFLLEISLDKCCFHKILLTLLMLHLEHVLFSVKCFYNIFREPLRTTRLRCYFISSILKKWYFCYELLISILLLNVYTIAKYYFFWEIYWHFITKCPTIT